MTRASIIVCACILPLIGVSAVRADIRTFQPTPADLWDLDHSYHYTWGLAWQVPEGQTIASAELTFLNVDNWQHPDPGNHLYTHLLDDVPPPSDPSATSWVIRGRDWQDGQDQFKDQGRLLGDYSDGGPGAVNLTYTIPETCFAWLADGQFGFGIDPDCHYFNNGITLTILTTEATPIPAPGAAVLGVIGLGLTGWVRRRRS